MVIELGFEHFMSFFFGPLIKPTTQLVNYKWKSFNAGIGP